MRAGRLPTVRANGPADGYSVPRKNIFWSAWVRHGGLYPDRQLRLFRRAMGRFVDSAVHESVVVEGHVETLADLPDRLARQPTSRRSRRQPDRPNGTQPAADVLGQSIPEVLDTRPCRTDDLDYLAPCCHGLPHGLNDDRTIAVHPGSSLAPSRRLGRRPVAQCHRLGFDAPCSNPGAHGGPRTWTMQLPGRTTPRQQPDWCGTTPR